MNCFGLINTAISACFDFFESLSVYFGLINITIGILLVVCSYRFILSPIMGGRSFGLGSDSVKKYNRKVV